MKIARRRSFPLRRRLRPLRLPGPPRRALLLLFLLTAGCPSPPARDSSLEGEPAEPLRSGVSGVSEPGQGMARFVIQTRPGQDAGWLADALESRYGSRAAFEPLFPESELGDDPDGMGRMYRVSVAQGPIQTADLWDAAYALEEDLGLAEAEPDLEFVSVSVPRGSCYVEADPPADKTWSLQKIEAFQAWKLVPPGAGRPLGDGISICHPDTGWAEHLELDSSRLDLKRARNLLTGGDSDARDPLDYHGPLLNPGHGTGTGTVIVSEHERGEIHGVAPRAKLVPIRTAKSVVQVLDSDLARAVNYSVDAGCDIISMSLGGRAFFGLRAATRRAVREDLIVAAAAGNCVGFVVAPAAYPECLAIAGTNVRQEPWIGSSRGRAVDVAAPGEHVWTARRRKSSAPIDGLGAGQGTSFAVANVAGAAALWLAFHDLSRQGGGRSAGSNQEMFRSVLGSSASKPRNWDPEYGEGILNVRALLEADLPISGLLPDPTESPAGHLEVLAAVVDRSPRELDPLLADLFSVETGALEEVLASWGPELIQLALADPPRFERLLDSLASEGVETPGELLSHASTRLQRRVQ